MSVRDLLETAKLTQSRFILIMRLRHSVADPGFLEGERGAVTKGVAVAIGINI
jgi:hypothetical protein